MSTKREVTLYEESHCKIAETSVEKPWMQRHLVNLENYENGRGSPWLPLTNLYEEKVFKQSRRLCQLKEKKAHGKMIETLAEKSWTRRHSVSLENYEKGHGSLRLHTTNLHGEKVFKESRCHRAEFIVSAYIMRNSLRNKQLLVISIHFFNVSNS